MLLRKTRSFREGRSILKGKRAGMTVKAPWIGDIILRARRKNMEERESKERERSSLVLEKPSKAKYRMRKGVKTRRRSR